MKRPPRWIDSKQSIIVKVLLPEFAHSSRLPRVHRLLGILSRVFVVHQLAVLAKIFRDGRCSVCDASVEVRLEQKDRGFGCILAVDFGKVVDGNWRSLGDSYQLRHLRQEMKRLTKVGGECYGSKKQ